MSSDLLQQLEQKVAHAVEIIELLRLQIEELEEGNSKLEEKNIKLEEDNIRLKAEQDKWRHDLMALIQRFDKIDNSSVSSSFSRITNKSANIEEEDFMSV